MARDRDNFGTGGSCRNTWSFSKYGVTVTMSGTWNCHGSTVHAYNGSGTGNANDTTLHGMVSGWTPQVYNAPITWSTLVSNLSRGDIVAFYASGSLQHTHTCRQSSTMYGANNEDVRGPETYIWAECTSERWWNLAGINNPPYPDCDRAIIYKRP